VKRLSLVKYLTAGRQHRSGWEAPLGAPQTARWPETAAGSVSTARSDMEASRDLGDPLWSWSAHKKTDRGCRTIWIIPEKGRCRSVKSDSLVVLKARQCCAQGEAAKQMKTNFRKHHLHPRRQELDVNTTESASEEGEVGPQGAVYVIGTPADARVSEGDLGRGEPVSGRRSRWAERRALQHCF